jgi:hypothetical protein
MLFVANFGLFSKQTTASSLEGMSPANHQLASSSRTDIISKLINNRFAVSLSLFEDVEMSLHLLYLL